MRLSPRSRVTAEAIAEAMAHCDDDPRNVAIMSIEALRMKARDRAIQAICNSSPLIAQAYFNSPEFKASISLVVQISVGAVFDDQPLTEEEQQARYEGAMKLTPGLVEALLVEKGLPVPTGLGDSDD